MNLTEFAEADAQLQETRQSLNRALRELDKVKRSKDEIVKAVYTAARDAASALELAPVPAPVKVKSSKDREVAVAVLSDWQLAKITDTYNTETCERRIEQYGDKVIELTNIQRSHHPVRELRVYLLGDLVEGELIFPGQAHLIDASLFRQVMVDGPRILTNFIRKMLAEFDTVKVVGVIGNHGALGGRARKDMHPESNADAIMYEASRLILEKQPRLDFDSNMSDGKRKWYAVDTIGDKSFFLFHGDQIKGGFAGYPWYGFGKRLNRWRNGLYEFDYALAGHFHTPVRLFENTITLWGNGSTESDNDYAAEYLSASGQPCQWLLFCHPERGVTAEYLVHLDV